MLQQSLLEAEIPHRWSGRTLVVSSDAEQVVDDLLDAIESGEAASLDESAEAPDGALNRICTSPPTGWCATAATAPPARPLLTLVPELSSSAPPFGLAGRPWSVIVARAQAIVAAIDAGAESDVVTAAADELRTVCRPYV